MEKKFEVSSLVTSKDSEATNRGRGKQSLEQI